MTRSHEPAEAREWETLYNRLREIDRALIHDVNSLLSGLGLALEMIDQTTRASLGDDDREALRLAERNARCMRDLVADYVELHRLVERLGAAAAHPYDVAEMLRDATTSADVRDRAVIRLDDGRPLPPVRGDRVLTGLALAVLLKSLPPADAPDAIVIAVRLEDDAIEVTVDATAAGPEFGLAAAHPRPPGEFVRRLFQTAVERQGGTTELSETPSGTSVRFTLPTAPVAVHT